MSVVHRILTTLTYRTHPPTNINKARVDVCLYSATDTARGCIILSAVAGWPRCAGRTIPLIYCCSGGCQTMKLLPSLTELKDYGRCRPLSGAAMIRAVELRRTDLHTGRKCSSYISVICSRCATS
jgi:hypothetical protein